MKLILSILFALMQLLNFSTAFCQEGNNDTNPKEAIYNSKRILTFLKAPLKDSLTLVEVNGKYGIIDSTGQVVVPLIYDKIDERFEVNIYFISNTSIREEYLYQLRYANELFYEYWQMGNESQKEYARLLKEELADSMSYLHLSNKFRSDPNFTAKMGDKWGVINKSNETILPFKYEGIREAGYDMYLAKKKGKYGVLDSKNNVIVPFVCDTVIIMFIYPFDIIDARVYGLLKVDGKYGLINLYTKQVLLPRYDDLEQCYSGVEDFCGCGFAEYWKYYQFPISFNYQNIHIYNNLLIFNKEDKYGILNMSTMQEITTDLYDSIRFKHKYRRNRVVYLNDKATFLTHDNSQLHPYVYDEVSTMNAYSSLYYFKVENDDLVGVFNKEGKSLLALNWEDVTNVRQLTDTSKYEFIIQEKGKFGVVNNDNQKVIPVRYDSISFAYNHGEPYYNVYRNSKSKKIIANE